MVNQAPAVRAAVAHAFGKVMAIGPGGEVGTGEQGGQGGGEQKEKKESKRQLEAEPGEEGEGGEPVKKKQRQDFFFKKAAGKEEEAADEGEEEAAPAEKLKGGKQASEKAAEGGAGAGASAGAGSGGSDAPYNTRDRQGRVQCKSCLWQLLQPEQLTVAALAGSTTTTCTVCFICHGISCPRCTYRRKTEAYCKWCVDKPKAPPAPKAAPAPVYQQPAAQQEPGGVWAGIFKGGLKAGPSPKIKGATSGTSRAALNAKRGVVTELHTTAFPWLVPGFEGGKFKCKWCSRARSDGRSPLNPKDALATGTANFRVDRASAHAASNMHRDCEEYCRNADQAADAQRGVGQLRIHFEQGVELLVPLVDNVLSIVLHCESLHMSYPDRCAADVRKGVKLPHRYLDANAAMDFLESACAVCQQMMDAALDVYGVRGGVGLARRALPFFPHGTCDSPGASHPPNTHY
jgi:hypothetical protein